MMPERKIPYSIEAEQAFLGALMLGDADAVTTGLQLLTRRDFYRNVHVCIFDAMQYLSSQKTPIDSLTLLRAMQELGTAHELGADDDTAIAYLLQIGDREFTTSNIAHYAKIVRDYSLLRQIIEVCDEYRTRGFDTEEDPKILLAQAESAILSIDLSSQSVEHHSVGTMVSDALAEAIDRKKNGKPPAGLATGLTDVDDVLDGLMGGDLMILAARPAMGKSACAASIALRVAGRAMVGPQSPVLFFSLEMSEKQLRQRFLASLSRVNMKAIKRGDFSDAEEKRMAKADEICRRWPLFVVDKSSLSASGIAAQCRRFRPSLIIVDYLQYLPTPEGTRRFNGNNEIVEANVKAMKNLARDADCPVILLSQLSRAVERREDKRPTMADLRDSGSIEQEADQVAFLYRPSYYQRATEKPADNIGDEVEFIIAKNRSGETDTVKLAFFPAWSRFDNYQEGGF